MARVPSAGKNALIIHNNQRRRVKEGRVDAVSREKCTLSMADELSLEIWQAEPSDSNRILEQANLERVSRQD